MQKVTNNIFHFRRLKYFTQISLILLVVFTAMTFSACKHYVGPSLFKGKEYTRLHYFGKDKCLSSPGGCSSWVLYIQEDHNLCQVFHSDNPKSDLKACATDCDWNYNRETGILKITLTETNDNFDYDIQNNLQGDFEWKDGVFGKRFYSKLNPDVSIYMD